MTRTTKPTKTGHKEIAQAAGYYIREGAYTGTTDNQLGRWYIGHNSDEFFRPFGRGHPNRGAAWAAVAEMVAETPTVPAD